MFRELEMINLINKDVSFLNDIKIAHRGLCTRNYPENSLSGFKECIERGIPIEFDVHILKDNTLVVIHDGNTERVTGTKVILKDAIYSDIKNLRLGNSDEKIPMLKEVLDLVNGKVLLDIELKGDIHDFRICHEICKYLDSYSGKFIIKSFNPIYIWWFRKNRPNYVRGILIPKKNILKIKTSLLICKPDFVAFNYKRMPNKMIDMLYQNGVPLLLYTVKEDEKISYNYTGIIYEGNEKVN